MSFDPIEAERLIVEYEEKTKYLTFSGTHFSALTEHFREDSLPFFLERLYFRPSWTSILVLGEITGQTPPPRTSVDLTLLTEWWLEWAEREGHLESLIPRVHAGRTLDRRIHKEVLGLGALEDMFLPRYSRDISSAWNDVLVPFGEGALMSVNMRPDRKFDVLVEKVEIGVEGHRRYDDTMPALFVRGVFQAPLAICIAALAWTCSDEDFEGYEIETG